MADESFETSLQPLDPAADIPISFEIIRDLINNENYRTRRLQQIVSPLLCDVEQCEIAEVERRQLKVTRSQVEPGFQGVGY